MSDGMDNPGRVIGRLKKYRTGVGAKRPKVNTIPHKMLMCRKLRPNLEHEIVRRIEDGTIDLFANSEMPSISHYGRNLVLPIQAIRCWQTFQKQTQMVMERTVGRD